MIVDAAGFPGHLFAEVAVPLPLLQRHVRQELGKIGLKMERSQLKAPLKGPLVNCTALVKVISTASTAALDGMKKFLA